MPILELSEFTCERDDQPLFTPLNLELNAGEIVQVAGPNGAGKTTLLRAICGLFAEFRGQLTWRGRPLQRPSFDCLSDMLYLGHQPGVKRSLTARENLEWFFGVQGRRLEESVEAIMAKVGLAGYEDIPCFNMSAGQQRRVALARLYATDAKVWVLDEPFTAIDKAGVAHLEALLQKHTQQGGAVLLTTHQSLTVERYRIVELQQYVGEVI